MELGYRDQTRIVTGWVFSVLKMECDTGNSTRLLIYLPR